MALEQRQYEIGGTTTAEENTVEGPSRMRHRRQGMIRGVRWLRVSIDRPIA